MTTPNNPFTPATPDGDAFAAAHQQPAPTDSPWPDHTTPAAAAAPAVATTAHAGGHRAPSAAVGHEFFRPQSAYWWVFVGMVAAGTIGILVETARGVILTRDALWLVAPLIVVAAAIFAWVLLALDRYRARRGWVLVLAFLGGAAVSTWLSLMGNAAIDGIVQALMDDTAAENWGAAFSGPTTEEWSKGLVALLVVLVASATHTRLIHGFLVGGFVGLGFQFVENVLYATNSAASSITSDIDGALPVTLLRSAIGFTSHWVYTAIIGVGIMVLLGRTSHPWALGRRCAVFVGLFAASYGLHFLWNSPMPGGIIQVPLMLAKMLLVVGVLAAVWRWVMREERSFLATASTAAATAGLLPDPAVAAAAGDHAARKAARRQAAQHASSRRARRAAAKALARQQGEYLDALQAWGRRGTGIDTGAWDATAA
ncbi:PrsW family intramembrane metalloprotease [Corynebacterium sp. 13CS0277]|uniref:PrsW family intramembrane metalloprotease n=1 Tax=Corynebacterium sp. 13CS0277 TaxID=2071994 RepID=UPI000D02DD4B|nr:PrsW family intramembrane metalloprotease [Corynebacterium sp. 13CS0277]PRQ11776.1 PrsW family intramembrane metalloprotease [Corynebacterium sp. 13CS0277]